MKMTIQSRSCSKLPVTNNFPSSCQRFYHGKNGRSFGRRSALHLPKDRKNRHSWLKPQALWSTPRIPAPFFRLFVGNDILATMVANTDKYAEMKGSGTGREWSDTGVGELKTFIGICLYTGLFRSPRLEAYCDRSGNGRLHRIATAVPLKQFYSSKHSYMCLIRQLMARRNVFLTN